MERYMNLNSDTNKLDEFFKSSTKEVSEGMRKRRI